MDEPIDPMDGKCCVEGAQPTLLLHDRTDMYLTTLSTRAMHE